MLTRPGWQRLTDSSHSNTVTMTQRRSSGKYWCGSRANGATLVAEIVRDFLHEDVAHEWTQGIGCNVFILFSCFLFVFYFEEERFISKEHTSVVLFPY